MMGAVLLGNRPMRLGAMLALSFAGAAIFGWRAGEVQAIAAIATTPPAWTLPAADLRDPARDVAVLTARHPWGGVAAFHDIDTPAPVIVGTPWRLAGIVERGDERLALVLVGQAPATKLEYRAVGDSLPDGSVLVQIDADSATSAGGKSLAAERRVYRLFDQAR